MRVPAVDIEAVVVGRLCAMLIDEGALMDAVALNGMLFECCRQAERLNLAKPMDVRTTLTRYIGRIDMHGDRVIVHVCRVSMIDGASPAIEPAGRSGEKTTLTVTARLGRVGKEVRLVVAPSSSMPMDTAPDRRDPAVTKLVVKAHAARAALMATSHESVDDIAQAHGYDRDYFGVLLRLSWLSPEMTRAISDGKQPSGLSRQSLARMAGLPMTWDEQWSC
jgi:site-specific DNA recombinase